MRKVCEVDKCEQGVKEGFGKSGDEEGRRGS